MDAASHHIHVGYQQIITHLARHPAGRRPSVTHLFTSPSKSLHDLQCTVSILRNSGVTVRLTGPLSLIGKGASGPDSGPAKGSLSPLAVMIYERDTSSYLLDACMFVVALAIKLLWLGLSVCLFELSVLNSDLWLLSCPLLLSSSAEHIYTSGLLRTSNYRHASVK